jgi:anti-sigma regulatory factor (Ser/Thr protein kinase)
MPGSSARLLEGSCPALGIAEVCKPPEIVVDFPPGATLALYTDGLIERRHEGIEAGLARLLGALASAPGDVDAVRDDVIEACLGPERVDDDVTALFVRAEPALGDTVRVTLTPDPDALAATRRMLRRWLVEMGAAPDEVAGIVMAANEAWQNAIEHGHDFAPVPVSVRFQREDDEVVVTIRDAGGRGRPPGDPDRGRGITLMQGLMDETKLDLGSHRGGLAILRRRIGVLAGTQARGQRGGAAA